MHPLFYILHPANTVICVGDTLLRTQFMTFSQPLVRTILYPLMSYTHSSPLPFSLLPPSPTHTTHSPHTHITHHSHTNTHTLMHTLPDEQCSQDGPGPGSHHEDDSGGLGVPADTGERHTHAHSYPSSLHFSLLLAFFYIYISASYSYFVWFLPFCLTFPLLFLFFLTVFFYCGYNNRFCNYSDNIYSSHNLFKRKPFYCNVHLSTTVLHLTLIYLRMRACRWLCLLTERVPVYPAN
jgi:hypothetical protein